MIDGRAFVLGALDLVLDEIERNEALRERIRRARRLCGAPAATPDADAFVNAKSAGIPRDTFNRACRTGAIAGARMLGREWRAPRSSVGAWSETLPTVPRTPTSASGPSVAKADATPANDASADGLDPDLARILRRRA